MAASDDAVLAALQAEYVAMRDEIHRLIDHEKDLLTLSFVVLGAVLALIGAILRDEGANDRVAFVLLLVPIVYLLFSLTAAEQTRRILQIAEYIYTNLRPRAEAISGRTGLWSWESWKADHYRELSRLRKVRVWVLERSRWITLTVPGVTALITYGALVGYDTSASVALLILDIAVMAIQVVVLIYTTEAPGVRAIHHEWAAERRGPQPSS